MIIIMGKLSSSCFIRSIICFLFSVSHAFASPASHLCRPDQKQALMEFKREFRIHRLDDDWMNDHPKTETWNSDVDCCSWDGVTCDSASGEVIELNLDRSLLNGPLGPNSSLFRLKHLQSLNLGANNLSGNLPDSIGNLRSLTVLMLYSCNLFGRIPSSLGNLSELTHLDLSSNSFTGEIPSSFGNLNRLTGLYLVDTKLGGDFPLVLLNLTELSVLDLRSNQFTGPLPSNISTLSKLEDFRASANSFSGTVPSSLFMIPSIIWVALESNQFTSPLEFGNVSSSSNLGSLHLGDNNFHGPIPGAISKLVGLWFLQLSSWNTGMMAVDFSMFSPLTSLRLLDLSYLNTRSTADLSIFSHLPSLSSLDLSGNNVNISTTAALPLQLDTLTLSSCNIDQFPSFLMAQRDLIYLDLSMNKIQGRVPEWLWELPFLTYVNISQNQFTAFEGSQDVIRGPRIYMLDISSNAFRGPLPMLPVSTVHLLSSANNFSGEIPQSVCDLISLQTLDLSNNNFSGSIPLCFDNLKSNLSVLHLQNNSLSGNLSTIAAYNLKSLNLGHNRFVGELPGSLINCTGLQLLNVESNKINGTFPFWLQSLPELRILVLRSNEFYGPIYSPRLSSGFQFLRMMDISQNHFSGTLPSNYFANWSAMSEIKTIKDRTPIRFSGRGSGYYHDSVVLTNKGLQMELAGSSFTIYTTIDFSGNELRGEIPESIGLLKEVIVLNLSNNAFTGHVPLSLVNLTNLESLDMSRNKLSGTLPPELGSLSFLAFMNFSHNKLVGPIPQGTQFQRQPCSAFLDNLGLYGPPLGQNCGEFHTPTPRQQESPDPQEEEEEVISWTAAGIGVVPGVVFGWTIGYIAASYKHEWFAKIFGLNKRRRSAIR